MIPKLITNFIALVIFIQVTMMLFGACVKAIYRGEFTRGGNFQDPIKDFVMVGHVMTTRSVGSRMECTFECLKSPQCVSINYEEIGKPLHTCELCNRSRKHYPLKLLAKSGWTYTDNNEEGIKCDSFAGDALLGSKVMCNTPGFKTYLWNNCPAFQTGSNCEFWTDDASNFEVQFPSQTTSDFGIIDILHKSMRITSFTISLWINPSREDTYSILSYATTSELKEIYLECTQLSFCRFTIKGKERTFRLGNPLNSYNKTWHHLSITWSNWNGDWHVHLDGAWRKSGQTFQRRSFVSGNGVLVLGQEQTTLGGGFNKTNSFQGKMTQVNIWSQFLSKYKIQELAQRCIQGSIGDVLAWRQLRHQFRGETMTTPSTTCQSRVSMFGYRFDFPSRKAENYIEYSTLGVLNSFTLCLWLKLNRTHSEGTGLFSYASSTGKLIELHIGYSNGFNLRVLNSVTKAFLAPLDGNHWNNLCITWENVDGKTEFYLDGVLRKTIRDFQKGITISSDGIVRLGVRQSSMGVVDPIDKYLFKGDLSHVNMWSRVITDFTIEAMAKQPGTDVGNLIAWPSLKEKAHGHVKTIAKVTLDLKSRETDFDLYFGETRNTANYAVFDGSVPLLSSFTACAWFRSAITKDYITFFSYAISNGSSNEMALFLKAVSSGATFCVFIKNKARRKDFSDYIILDYNWHHYCVTWTTVRGQYEMYVDGTEFIQDVGFQEGATIDAGGKLIVGQEQDSYGGGFETFQAMVGMISRVNVWERVFTSNLIQQMAIGADFTEGSVVAWHAFRRGIKGSLRVTSPSFCTLQGKTLQIIRSEYCTGRYGGTDERTGCSNRDIALFGTYKKGKGRSLRCYALDMLKQDENGYSYDEVKEGTCYNTISSTLMNQVE